MTAPALVHPADFLDSFAVPSEQQATTPPALRGMKRDDVRLMVSGDAGIQHLRFTDLGSVLTPQDLLVVNTSATMPASVVLDDRLAMHFSSRLPGDLHIVELRTVAGVSSLPYPDTEPGRLQLPGGGTIELLAPYPAAGEGSRLWVATVDVKGSLPRYLETWGRPIRYSYIHEPLPIEAYQTVFANAPGSAEMPSAGRPFSRGLVTSLVSSGVTIAPILLHTGVSSLETGEPPYPEWYQVAESTAAQINHTRAQGGRVIAVGTTVVRTLETVADSSDVAHPGRGWTDLVIGPDDPIRIVDGMITGWHEPTSTHLDMLQALASRPVLASSYEAALEHGYLWHEFGDSHLLLSKSR